MPKHYIYYLAMLMLLGLSYSLFHGELAARLWYAGHHDMYYAVSSLQANPQAQMFLGGWVLPCYLIAAGCMMHTYDHGEISEGGIFALLPVFYGPFMVIGTVIFTGGQFEWNWLYSFPLISIFFGYLYVLPWLVCVWVFEKFHIVV